MNHRLSSSFGAIGSVVTTASRLSLASCVALVCALAFASPAGATGLVRVQQSDGSIQEYPNATIRYSKDAKTLTVTTADGKGTLVIDQAACSYVEQLYRCLLTHMTLTQNGQTNPLDFETGTIYANTTDAKQNLPLSSQSLPPNGIVMALKTKKGTYISMTGTIDSGVK
jgi:hypothetical protein